MEKTIVINDVKLPLKSTGATPLRYKAQFKTDYLKDIIMLQKFGALTGKYVDPSEIEDVDFSIIYNIVYIFAKTANNEIGDPLDFFDSFDSFPIFDVLGEVQDMIMATLATTKKN